MGLPHTPSNLLRCPVCCGTMDREDPEASLVCKACDKTYPIVSGIPLLFRDPEVWLRKWSLGLARFVRQMTATEKQLLVEFMDQDLSERSRNRVRQVVEGLAQHRQDVLSLLATLGVHPESSADEVGETDYCPETYLTLVHRDYAWSPESDEVSLSWERLLGILPTGFEPRKTLVLGAGTGRLPWQIASRWNESSSVLAVDVNPLPFAVTAQLLTGASLSMTELPAHPRRSTLAALRRELSCSLPPANNLQLVFADGLAPPVEKGSFDTVITPWFVDQVPKDAAQIPRLVHELLRPGGSYISTGPFLYEVGHTPPSLRYCADEFAELVSASGFRVTAASYETEAYLASPLSTQGRMEHVLYLHARKVDAETVTARTQYPFLIPGRGASIPIPRPDGLTGMHFAPQEVTEVARLIDGRRSVLSITGLLVERGVLADDGSADAAVRGCLKVIFRQTDDDAPR